MAGFQHSNNLKEPVDCSALLLNVIQHMHRVYAYHWLVCCYLPPTLGLDVIDGATNKLAPSREFLHSSSFTSAVVFEEN